MTTKEILEALKEINLQKDFNEEDKKLITNLLQNKVFNIYYVIKHLEKDIDEYKNIIDKYKSKINNTQHKIDFLKDLMLQAVKQENIKYITDEDGVILYTISQRQSYSIIITDENNIPDNFKKVSYTIDKNKLKDYIAEGNIVEGCYIETKDYLTIH